MSPAPRAGVAPVTPRSTTPATSRSPTGSARASPRSGTRGCSATSPARARPRARSTPTCCSCTPAPRAPGTAGRRGKTRGRAPPPASSPAPRSGAAAARPGWRREPRRRDHAPRLPGRGRRRAGRAYRARAGAGARRVDGRAGSGASSRRMAASPALALAGADAQPVQLVRDDRRRRRDRQRRRPRARRRRCGATSPASPRRAAPATSAPACTSATTRAGRSSPVNFDSAEYANIVLGFSRVYGQARAAGMRAARAARAAARMGPARAGRLLDPCGLPELGHRPGLPALAPAQEGRPRAGRADRDRRRAGAGALTALGRAGPSGCSTAGCANTSRSSERDDRVPAALAYGVHAVPEPRRMAYLTAARYAANAVRALDAGLGRAPASEPPAAVLVRPRHGPARGHDPVYNTAIVAANSARTPTAGSSSRGCSTRDQEVAANIGGTGGERVRRPRARSRAAAAAHPVRRAVRPRPRPGARARAARRRRERGGTRRAYAGPFTDLRVRGRVAAAGCARSRVPLHADDDRGSWTSPAAAGTRR